MNHYIPSTPASQKGIVLIESLIAVLLFSLGILALVGLQAAMIKNTSEAKYRAEASFIAQQRLGDIWVNSKNHSSLADYVVADEDLLLPDGTMQLPSGKRSVAVSAGRTVTVTVTWALPGQATHQYSANARIEGIY